MQRNWLSSELGQYPRGEVPEVKKQRCFLSVSLRFDFFVAVKEIDFATTFIIFRISQSVMTNAIQSYRLARLACTASAVSPGLVAHVDMLAHEFHVQQVISTHSIRTVFLKHIARR